jgi:2-polyprenyl-6-hydroxyphenyl methylase/3-demethylubiquinone-9 3-methyltransferase
MGAIRAIIDGQMRLCRSFDRLLPARYSVDGNRHFIDVFVPKYLKSNMTVYDVGGGKTPYITIEKKWELSLVVVGIDIDADELRRAPEGVYDETICADITRYQGKGDADLVICQALLEHVKDVDAAFAALAGILKPGGRVLVFTPSKYALYALLNRLLPETLKKRLLFSIFQDRRNQGSRAITGTVHRRNSARWRGGTACGWKRPNSII